MRLRAFTLFEVLALIAVATVLVFILLPVSVVAREKSRLKACMNNLNQLGVAFEGYTADYSGYYPCWPGVGADDWMFQDGDGLSISSYRQCASKSAAGVMCDWNKSVGIAHNNGPSCAVRPAVHMKAMYGGKPGDTPVATGSPLISYYRCIGVGVGKTHDTTGGMGEWGRSAYDSGLSIAPNGLGYLLTGGYIKDAGSFYCPSSDAMLSDELYDATGGYRLSDWEKAGGFDRDTMLYGRWNSIGPAWAGRAAIFSHYAYRNVPLLVSGPWCASLEEANDPRITLTLTQPLQNLRFGAAIFPTQAQLGARALVSDTFSKTCHREDGAYTDALGSEYTYEQTLANNAAHPGMGMTGHRGGYNVLYGDGSVAWFSDPDQKIIWHQQSYGTPHWGTRFQPDNPGTTTFNLLSSNYFNNEAGVLTMGYGPYGGTDRQWACFRDTSASVWHDFDTANRMDLFEPLEEDSMGPVVGHEGERWHP